MELIEFASICAERWGEKTLFDFLQEAMSKDSGMIYDAMRQKDGQRAMLIVCATGEEALAHIAKQVDLGDDGQPSDWTKLTLVELVLRSATAGGLCYEAFIEDGDKTAVILCATNPEMANIVSELFALPASQKQSGNY